MSSSKNDYGARAALAHLAIEECHPAVRPRLATLVTRNTLAQIKDKNRSPLRYTDLSFIKNRIKFAYNAIFHDHMHESYKATRDLNFLPKDLQDSRIINQKNYEHDRFCLDEIKRISKDNIAASALLEAAFNK